MEGRGLGGEKVNTRNKQDNIKYHDIAYYLIITQHTVMATTIERQEALALLESPTNLTILSLSEPILSHATNDDVERTTPDTLKADLAHYRDLFGKLRFSYVEQVTKERFLKAICAHPPELATAQQNAQLEADLRGAKAALKAKKLAMEHALAEIETMGRRLAQSEFVHTFGTEDSH